MKLAIISDIHGNYDAFQKVMADIDKSGVDRIISLGDNIGYGPEPDRVVQKIMARDIPSVQGNHELAVKDEEYLNWFNPVARKSLIKTSDLLSESSNKFVTELEPFLTLDDCRYVHGFPPDSPLIYMFQASERRKKQIFEEIPQRLCFIGHTHTLEIISYDGNRDLLVVGFKNTNIDLVSRNDIQNIPDIKRKQLTGNKTIHNLTIIGEFAYISCGFGIVELNLEKKEIQNKIEKKEA